MSGGRWKGRGMEGCWVEPRIPTLGPAAENLPVPGNGRRQEHIWTKALSSPYTQQWTSFIKHQFNYKISKDCKVMTAETEAPSSRPLWAQSPEWLHWPHACDTDPADTQVLPPYNVILLVYYASEVLIFWWFSS